MAYTTTITGGSWLGTARRWFSRIVNPLDAVARASRRRRQMDELSKLDSRLLEDIGLTRGDVIAYSGPDKNQIEALCHLR